MDFSNVQYYIIFCRRVLGQSTFIFRGVITLEHLGQMLHIKTQIFAQIGFF